jgi:hypothetical protein
MDKAKKQKQGRLNRQRGAAWEHYVRDDLISKGWNVSKFQSNVRLTLNLTVDGEVKDPEKIIKLMKGFYKGFRLSLSDYPLGAGYPIIEPKAKDIIINIIEGKEVKLDIKGKLIPAMTSNKFRRGTLGLPDFICWRQPPFPHLTYELIGVEAKVDGRVDIIERAKFKWLLDNHIFSKIIIVKKNKEGNKVIPEYIEFGN